MNKPMQGAKTGFTDWLEWFLMAGIVVIALAAVFTTFISEKAEHGEGSVFSQLTSRVDALGHESDPIRRDAMCIPLSSFCRSIDAQLPTNSRVFLLDMLGTENCGKLGYYYFLNYYLYPREVGVSIGAPATFELDVMAGRNPASVEELTKAGYDLVLRQTPEGSWQSQVLKPMPPRAPDSKPALISRTDTYIAFLLPLAVALAGSRLVRWFFKDLVGVLTTGEWLASGLAVGMFLLTQLTFGLRIIGARLEQFLGYTIMIWALVELALLIRNWKSFRLRSQRFNMNYFWCLLLVPLGLMFWCLFRLAGLEGLQEFDAVAFWMFQAKIMYNSAGMEIWTLANNPAFAYAHFDYPKTVPFLYSITYGVLGHVNEFVIKFWNQWMLFFLTLAILGAGQFPKKRPWLVASATTIIILLPFTLIFTRNEGGTIPLFFYVALASVQIAIGLADKQEARLRLGLFLLMGAAMVKLEGAILLGILVLLLLLSKESRTALWPIKRVGLAGLVGLMAWIPYFVYRSHLTTVDPNAMGLRLAMQNWKVTLDFAPMIWVVLVSGRLLNNDFASWGAPGNQHAIWIGKWSGWGSLVDGTTFGAGWMCVLAFIIFWLHGHRFRWAALCFFSLFIIYTIPICLEFLSAAVRSDQVSKLVIDYSSALNGANQSITGGRYLSPLLISCLVVISVLLSRRGTEQLLLSVSKEKQATESKRRKR